MPLLNGVFVWSRVKSKKMTYRNTKSRPLRIHITNSKQFGRMKVHKICYCGRSYDDFGSGYQHRVYTLFALTSNIFGETDKKHLCPDCLDNPELGMDLLLEIDQ